MVRYRKFRVKSQSQMQKTELSIVINCSPESLILHFLPPLQGQFFLSFFILTQSLVTIQNPPFSPSAANIVHQILTYVYLILIIVLFLIAMGNRPQG